MCDARIKSNSLWEWGFGYLFTILISFSMLLAINDVISPLVVFVIIALMLIIGLCLFPYVTKFDLVDKPPEDNKKAD